jgi:hypothetical protein
VVILGSNGAEALYEMKKRFITVHLVHSNGLLLPFVMVGEPFSLLSAQRQRGEAGRWRRATSSVLQKIRTFLD